MARDRTPDDLVIVNDNFTNENHEEVAHILEDEWGADMTIIDVADKYDGTDGRPEHSRSIFHKVYRRYMGVPESLFNDGLHDNRTIKQLKRDYGSMVNYLEAREDGEVDYNREPEPDDKPDNSDSNPSNDETMIPVELAMKISEMAVENYRMGYLDGIAQMEEYEGGVMDHPDIFEDMLADD